MSPSIRLIVTAVAVASISALGVAPPTSAHGAADDSVQADSSWCC